MHTFLGWKHIPSHHTSELLTDALLVLCIMIKMQVHSELRWLSCLNIQIHVYLSTSQCLILILFTWHCSLP